jgi:TonB family protein
LLKKHSSEKLPLRVQPTLSKSQQTQKLSTHPIEATPLQVRPRAEAPEPLKIKPLHDKPLPTREKTENQLDFPLSANKSIERADSSQVLSGKQLEFGTSRLVEKKRDSSSLQSSFDGGTSTFKRRQLGIPKEKETDKNQFGIFAGRRVEEPQLKDAVQEIVQPEEKKENLTEEAEAAKALQTEEQIEGPVKGRALIRRPQPPKVDISIDVELKFKFWVLPDGTIGEVIPVKRGNAQLERIAIAYLKQWRFEPLPSGASQEKIWGTIPIRFSVQ